MKKNIEELINKFYEGRSTQEEELFLTEYFLNEKNVDERWKEEQKLFRLIHESQIKVPEGVSERLEKSILQMEVSEKIQPRKRSLLYWISSAAAVALLCIGLFFTPPESAPQEMADTYTDPEEAALVAEQTLAFMSLHLNKGLNKVNDVEVEFEKLNQLINKHLNN